MKNKNDLLRALDELDISKDILVLEAYFPEKDEKGLYPLYIFKDHARELFNEWFPTDDLVGQFGVFGYAEITNWHYQSR